MCLFTKCMNLTTFCDVQITASPSTEHKNEQINTRDDNPPIFCTVWEQACCEYGTNFFILASWNNGLTVDFREENSKI